MKYSELIVSFNEKKVGELKVNVSNNQLSFIYDAEWLKNGFPISPHIPLFDIEAQNENISTYIDNLLPEDENREILAKHINVSRTSIFALLSKIGMDVSGGLTFSNSFPIVKRENEFREITHKELAAKLDTDKSEELIYWDGKPRLSIAGVQRKLAVLIQDNKMGFADGEICSNTILKFQKLNMKERSVVLNEYVCMELAKKSKIDVPNVQLNRVGEHLYLLVDRFDRKVKQDKVEKIHVIDGCQFLNLQVSHKYERPFGSEGELSNFREGASFKKIYQALSISKSPIQSKLKMLRWFLFNLIIGNCDAHAKNISFFQNSKGCELTPFYDLVCVEIYKSDFDTELAMAVGDEFNSENIGVMELTEFCDDTELKPKLVSIEFFRLIDQVEKALKDLEVKIKLEAYEESFLSEIKKFIQDRINHFEKIFGELS